MANDKIGIHLNRNQADMLLRGLDKLEPADKASVVYKTLVRDLQTIITIWDRRIKNEKILLKTKPIEKVYPAPARKPLPQTSTRQSQKSDGPKE